jgi:acetyl esterase/lipase
MLLYPVLDVSLASASIQAMGETDVEGMGRMWGYYTGTPIDQTPRYASPAAREDLAGLAPACVVAGELDSLRDEAIAYAQRLLTAGVSVELQVWPKAPHAVDLFAPEARISRQSVKQQADALVRFLG